MKVARSCLTLWPHGLYCPWNSPGQNTGLGSVSLFQGTVPTQRSNPGLLHCRRILYQLSHKGSPRILEWVTCPVSRSSRPRNRTGVSCIAGRFFTNCALREAPHCCSRGSVPDWGTRVPASYEAKKKKKKNSAVLGQGAGSPSRDTQNNVLELFCRYWNLY